MYTNAIESAIAQEEREAEASTEAQVYRPASIYLPNPSALEIVIFFETPQRYIHSNIQI